MTVTVREVADWVGGEVLGDGDQPIARARPLSDAGAGDLTFVEHDRHLPAWHHSRAAAAIVTPTVPVNGRPLIRVADPLMAFAAVVQRLRGPAPTAVAGRVHPTAVVHPTATVGPDAAIGPFVVVGEGAAVGPRAVVHAGVSVGAGCRVGADVTLHPHVVLYPGVVLGDRVTVHANAVIGADGFGYRTHAGRHVKVPQIGGVEIADDVEIGAGTTIDGGTFEPTRVGEGTKIDNLVQIGHNCRIGRHNLLVAQVGIAGSTTTGDYVVMAGQAGVADHIAVGDRAVIGAKCGVSKDVPADARLLGAPATPDREWLRMMLSLEKLPELVKEVRRLKAHLGLEDG